MNLGDITLPKDKPRLVIIQSKDNLYSFNLVVSKEIAKDDFKTVVHKVCDVDNLDDLQQFANDLLQEISDRRDYEKISKTLRSRMKKNKS